MGKEFHIDQAHVESLAGDGEHDALIELMAHSLQAHAIDTFKNTLRPRRHSRHLKGKHTESSVLIQLSSAPCACGDTNCDGLSDDEIAAAKRTQGINSQTNRAFYTRCPEYDGQKLTRSTPSNIKKTWVLIRNQIRDGALLSSLTTSSVSSDDAD